MTDELIDPALAESLRKIRSTITQAMASDLVKLNKLARIDPEMAVVRARRILELMLRNIAGRVGVAPDTNPLDRLLAEIIRAQGIPKLIEPHCRVVKDFGNIAAHGVDGRALGSPDLPISEVDVSICAEAIASVIRWYLENVASTLPEEINLRIFSGRQVTRAMIDQAIALDFRLFPESFRGNSDTCYAWHDRNPDIYTMVLDGEKNEVIGYINAMPIEEEQYRKIESGASMDMEIPVEMIRAYDVSDFYLLYFMSVAVHPEYRTTNAFRALYDAFLAGLVRLSKSEVFITEILADAITPDGERLCRYAGLKEVGGSTHGSRIYKATLLPPALRVTTNAGRSLMLLYAKKYSEFRELLQGSPPP